ncbi:MAG: NAD(P)H-hydrate dehydratase [Candidatus Hydrogenedentes bacterium]|nr:NAD(P)H-hydrate dehydratase [Candidatus Hydrogenedentota bacterium]
MAVRITGKMVRELLPKRPVDAHKGTFGHVYVIAGSRGLTGAAKLSCLAAARSGVGLVTLGIPRALADVFAASLMEVMTHTLPCTHSETLAEAAVDMALEFAKGKQAVVLGPGISQHPQTRGFVERFVSECPAPLVVDADGLNCLSGNLDLLEVSPASKIITPHPGEMARLLGVTTDEVQKHREKVASCTATERRCVVVLKGHRTVVADAEGHVYVNTTGNSGMATGGTGDVLSGLIGGLLAQGLSAADAARVGVFLHGLAGDLAAKTATERGMIADDLLEAIPRAWKQLEPKVRR